MIEILLLLLCGTIVKLGRMKGNIKYGSNVYKIASKELSSKAINSYNNCENIKIPLNATIDVHQGKPIQIYICTINTNDSFYNDISFSITSNIIPEKSINKPITKERIIKQLIKTSNTPYEFTDICVNLDDNLYIPRISEINELRRNCIKKLENIITEKYCNNDSSKIPEALIEVDNKTFTNLNKKSISILLNTINLDFNYTLLKNVQNIYIPLKYFVNKNYFYILKDISYNFNLYIYMPVIMRKNYTNIFKNNITTILSSFNIKGFVISNIGNLRLLKDYTKNYKFIGNYTLNLFNNLTEKTLKDLHIETLTLSPELNKNDLITFNNKNNCETIVYGNTPIMNMNYCLLGKSNHCYSNCSHKCNSNNKFYIKDRLGFKFRVIPDNIETVTTIYNSKTTFIDILNINCKSYRIDILDENIDFINNITSAIIDGNKIEGKNFTNGNFNRFV